MRYRQPVLRQHVSVALTVAIALLCSAFAPTLPAANCDRKPDHPSCGGGEPPPPPPPPPPEPSGTYVIYLSEYLSGDFYLAALPDLSVEAPGLVAPRLVSLERFRGKLANPDVSADGRRIVFAAVVRNAWNIYVGALDAANARVTDIRLLVPGDGQRVEDARFSWDGEQVVYKCANDICVHPPIVPNPLIHSACELWAPVFHPGGTRIAYSKRCEDSDSDRIEVYDVATGVADSVPNADGGPDRFPTFRGDGRLIYSHAAKGSGLASLWAYAAGGAQLFHDRTESDDDPYAHKLDWELLAFIGYDQGYQLFVHRESRGDSVQLTSGVPVLGPVIFQAP